MKIRSELFQSCRNIFWLQMLWFRWIQPNCHFFFVIGLITTKSLGTKFQILQVGHQLKENIFLETLYQTHPTTSGTGKRLGYDR